MAGSTNKKVSIVRFDREPVAGFVNPQAYLTEEGMEVLSLDGFVLTVPYAEVKAVCFVRDFDDAVEWQRHRGFNTRPKSEGLWVRVQFRDGDWLEGTIANDLNQVEPQGVGLVPPDPGAGAQRIFVPRQATQAVQVLGVIGSPLRRRPAKPKEKEPGQMEMFG